MGNCTIPGCYSQAVAWGLCTKHYMRNRRHGDPNAAFKRGRPVKPRPEDPETVALRQTLAKAEAKFADLGGEIANLQWQLKAAITQAQNERLIWLEPLVLNRLRALRGPGESYSDVILKLIDLEAELS
jgi:hypothetical protein